MIFNLINKFANWAFPFPYTRDLDFGAFLASVWVPGVAIAFVRLFFWIMDGPTLSIYFLYFWSSMSIAVTLIIKKLAFESWRRKNKCEKN